MDWQGIQFHNVAELETQEQQAGYRLHRFPKVVRHTLEVGRVVALRSSGCELRFVSEAPSIRVTMSSSDIPGRVLVFRGDFLHASYILAPGIIQTLNLEYPERFSEVQQDILENKAFSSKVWRICCDAGFQAIFYNIDTFGYDIRPPHKVELPRIRLLAYGSSITQGEGALSYYNSYVQQAAQRLQVDALNFGLSGSCYCEMELADFLAARQDWDMAFLEMGVNMRGVVDKDEFKKRTLYLLDELISLHPNKPIFLTTIFPNRAGYFLEQGNIKSIHEQQYNQTLRDYVLSKNHPNLHLLEGGEILSEFTWLTSDLIHPSDYGHIRMGENLAEMLSDDVAHVRSKVSIKS